jgi:Cu-processing system permease protein
MRAVSIVAAYALRESVRRKVFLVVLILTAGFLGLYALGAWKAFDEVGKFGSPGVVDDQVLAGSTLVGLAMFTTLFLGTVLAVFLTLSAVRGDAENGLLQPLLVRPVSREAFLLGRFAGAAVVCAAYVIAVYAAAVVITHAAGGWWPDEVTGPGLGLAAGVVIVAAVSLLGSVFLSQTANGIAVFMVFGAGLTAGLLGQIGEALGSRTLDRVADIVSWILPFEALYQAALAAITTDTVGFTRLAINLGPFGGAEEAGPWLWPWTVVYLALVGIGAAAAFARRDL